MNRRLLILLCLMLPFLAAIVFLMPAWMAHDASVTEELPSIASDDNPFARADFEANMLRDPRSGTIPVSIRAREHAFASTLPKKSAADKDVLGKIGEPNGPLFTWKNRGPVNVAGRTRAVAIDISNPDVILAGGVSGGMWRSSDGGQSWRKTTDPQDLHSVTDVVQDTRPGFTDNWYYCTGELLGNSASEPGAFYYGNGVYKSSDGGQSWSSLEATTTQGNTIFDNAFDLCWRVVVNPVADGPGDIFVAAFGAIHRSSDGGASFRTVLGSFGNNSADFTDVAVSAGGVLYATLSSDGTVSGVFRSTDGENWTDITPESWPPVVRRTVLDIAPSDENIVYFYSNSPGHGFRDVTFWRYEYLGGDGSGDDGAWEERWQNLPGLAGRGTINTQTSYNMIVRAHPLDVNTVFIGGTTLFRSSDAFSSIDNTTRIGGFQATIGSYRDYLNHHPDQHNLKFYPGNPDRMLSTGDAGVFRTEDNRATVVEWEVLNNGYQTTQFYGLAIERATAANNFIMGGLQDRGTWYTTDADGSVPWKRFRGSDGAFCGVADGGTSYYVSIQNGIVRRFLLDENGNKRDSTRVDPLGARDYLFINPFTLDPTNTDRMYLCAGRVVMRNDDLTAIPMGSNNVTKLNWQEIEESRFGSDQYSAIAVSTNPPNRVYAGNTRGFVIRIDNAHGDDPEVSNISNNSGFPTGGYVGCIAVDPGDYDRALVVFTNYNVRSLFLTEDGGTSWTAVGGNLEENPDGSGNGPSLRWAAFLPDGDDMYYFVATSVGLYSTTLLDGANTIWEQEAPELIGNTVVTMIDTRPVDGYIAVSTHGAGIFSSSVLSDAPPASEVPSMPFTIGNSYPNPFETETSMRLSLYRSAALSMRIVDLQGRRVRTLFSKRQIGIGEYTMVFDGRDDHGARLPAGRYYWLVEGAGMRLGRNITLK